MQHGNDRNLSEDNIQKESERINSFAMMETIITHFHEKNTDYIDTEMAELR